MRFMLEQPIPELLIDSDKVLRAAIGGDHDIVVTIATREPVLLDSVRSGQPICTAYGTWGLRSEHAATFDALARGDENALPDKRHKFPPDRWVLPDFAEDFADAVKTIHRQLRDASERVVSLMRWRHAVIGPNEPLAGGCMGFSLDGENWVDAPSDYRLRVVGMNVIQDFLYAPIDVETYARSDAAEPLHWELYREAENLRENSPRSALLTLVASAETGVKTTIAHLAPDTRWLVERGPSPPLVDLIWKYIPTLDADAANGGTAEVLPKKPFRRVMQTAAEARNKLAHVGAEPPSADFVVAVAVTVRALLWKLDLARGHAWARRHVHVRSAALAVRDALASQS